MRKFKRHGAVISSQLSGDEVALLESLVGQLVDMLTEDDAAASTAGAPGPAEPRADENADPFVLWAQELEESDAVPRPDDPVLRRLFPDAYTDDPEASAEFRRFTDRDLRGRKVSDAQTALAHLAETGEGRTELRIPLAETEAWLRTLTSLRLAVATRLGIDDARMAEELADLPEEDPRAYLASVYDWLGFAQETLVNAL